MTEDCYQDLCVQLDRLFTNLKAGYHGKAIEGALRFQAILLREMQAMQLRIDALTAIEKAP